jgi:hypothetical protein
MGLLTPSEPPYWQINVAIPDREAHCPPFLSNLNPKDLGIISTPDSQYHVLTWPEVQQIIGRNRIDLFQRVPSQLRRYLAYNYDLKQQYGSVMEFVLQERLGWTLPVKPEGKPFEKKEDLKVLWNDWPYGIDKRIVHLVVWTKFVLEDDPATDDLTPEARREIDGHVDRVFGEKLGKENVSLFRFDGDNHVLMWARLSGSRIGKV